MPLLVLRQPISHFNVYTHNNLWDKWAHDNEKPLIFLYVEIFCSFGGKRYFRPAKNVNTKPGHGFYLIVVARPVHHTSFVYVNRHGKFVPALFSHSRCHGQHGHIRNIHLLLEDSTIKYNAPPATSNVAFVSNARCNQFKIDFQRIQRHLYTRNQL